MSSVEHFRWPFCREYEPNPRRNDPPRYFTYTNPITGVETERNIYVPVMSPLTSAQYDADERLARILKVSFGILILMGVIWMSWNLLKNI